LFRYTTFEISLGDIIAYYNHHKMKFDALRGDEDVLTGLLELERKKTEFLFTVDSRTMQFTRTTRTDAYNRRCGTEGERGFCFGFTHARTERSLNHLYALDPQQEVDCTIGVHHLVNPRSEKTHSIWVHFKDAWKQGMVISTNLFDNNDIRIKPESFFIEGDGTFTPIAWDVNEFKHMVDDAVSYVCKKKGMPLRCAELNERIKSANDMYDGLVARFAEENGKVVRPEFKGLGNVHRIV
jgi:hypothetical protein